jgi:hypothetical protein
LKHIQNLASAANDVMMSMSAKPNYTALLLEGWDDLRLYANFTHERCLTFPVDGRPYVLGILQLLAKRNKAGAAGIIDADLDHLNGTCSPANVFITDCRDAECQLINSSALDRVLREHLVTQDSKDVRQFLFSSCRDLGYLRWAADSAGWSLDFKKLVYRQFINVLALTTDRNALCVEILRVNPGFMATIQELKDAITNIEKTTHKAIHVCAGHDLTAVLALYVSQISRVDCSKSEIERQLRLAVDRPGFAMSQMVKRILTWETQNSPLRILSDSIAKTRAAIENANSVVPKK